RSPSRGLRHLKIISSPLSHGELFLSLCARQGALLGSVSLLWAVSSGTTHLSQGVHREVESEGADDEIRIRRTETGYEALVVGNIAIDMDARFSTVTYRSSSCEALRK